MSEHRGPRCWACNGTGWNPSYPSRTIDIEKPCWQCRGTGVYPSQASTDRPILDSAISMASQESPAWKEIIKPWLEAGQPKGWTKGEPIKWTKDEQAPEPFDKDKLKSEAGFRDDLLLALSNAGGLNDIKFATLPPGATLTPSCAQKLWKEALKLGRPVTEQETMDILVKGSDHKAWAQSPEGCATARDYRDWNEWIRQNLVENQAALPHQVSDKTETTEALSRDPVIARSQLEIACRQAGILNSALLWASGQPGAGQNQDQTHTANGIRARLARLRARVRNVRLPRPNQSSPGQPKQAQTRQAMPNKSRRTWALWLAMAWLGFTAWVGRHALMGTGNTLTDQGLLLTIMLLAVIALLAVRYLGE